MKMIGLIGGLSWESSAVYYRLINQQARNRLGPTASARCLLWSFNFADIQRLQRGADWSALADELTDAACRLEGAGADILLICSNTMHQMADAVQQAVSIPLLHIADPTAVRITSEGIGRVGLIGTTTTMQHEFYKGRLSAKHGLDVLVPEEGDQVTVHRIIHEELIAGINRPDSKLALRSLIGRLVDRGAEAIILGCTELMLLVGDEDSAVPLFDTATLHAEAAVAMALQD